MDRAEVLRRRLRGTLDGLIRRRLKGEHYSLVHALSTSLPTTEVESTNFDSLFETRRRVLAEASVLPLDKTAVPGHRWLLKMHGSISPRRPDHSVPKRLS